MRTYKTNNENEMVKATYFVADTIFVQYASNSFASDSKEECESSLKSGKVVKAVAMLEVDGETVSEVYADTIEEAIKALERQEWITVVKEDDNKEESVVESVAEEITEQNTIEMKNLTITPCAFDVLSANAIEGNCLTIREYAEAESQSDPSFFRWFFDDDDLEDFQNPNEEAFEKWLNDNDATFTFDVVFNDDNNSSSKGFKNTKQECIDYIKNFNGTNDSYFADYKGGNVEVMCNETETIYYRETVE